MTPDGYRGPMIGFLIGGSVGLLGLWLTGCTQGQVDPAKVAVVDSQLQLACDTAMALAPAAGPIAPYILAGCGTAEGLAKLASDPASIQWVNGLIAQVKALRHS